MEIIPDKKLFTKLTWVLATISASVLLAGIILQIVIPLGGKTTPEHVASILWPIEAVILVLSWVIVTPLLRLWVNNLSYYIEDERITVHKGFIAKVQQNIPYRAVTDFMLYRSLYDRILGIASIRIQTAGQGPTPTGYEGNIAGLVNYEKLLHNLRERLRDYKGTSVLTASDKISGKIDENEIRVEVLNELKAIRKLLEEKK